MSLATVDTVRPRSSVSRPSHSRHLSAVPSASGPGGAADASAAPAATASAPAPAPAPARAAREGTEARGFVLYVGIDEAKAAAAGTSLGEIVEQLKRLTAELSPDSETHAAVALAPAGVGGRDVDVVRLALQDPAALARRKQDQGTAKRASVVIDLSRKRVLLDDEPAPVTYKEYELLQYLVLREGRTIERAELISALWNAGDEDAPNERTIDVHVRRLRSKLGAFEDVVRTVRGAGYRFDRHADVSIRYGSAPSPDFF